TVAQNVRRRTVRPLSQEQRLPRVGGCAMKARIVGHIAFGGDCEACDPDAAADALREAGYTVARYPLKYRVTLLHPLDNIFMVWREVPISNPDIERVADVVWDQINNIVDATPGSATNALRSLCRARTMPTFERWR